MIDEVSMEDLLEEYEGAISELNNYISELKDTTDSQSGIQLSLPFEDTEISSDFKFSDRDNDYYRGYVGDKERGTKNAVSAYGVENAINFVQKYLDNPELSSKFRYKFEDLKERLLAVLKKIEEKESTPQYYSSYRIENPEEGDDLVGLSAMFSIINKASNALSSYTIEDELSIFGKKLNTYSSDLGSFYAPKAPLAVIKNNVGEVYDNIQEFLKKSSLQVQIFYKVIDYVFTSSLAYRLSKYLEGFDFDEDDVLSPKEKLDLRKDKIMSHIVTNKAKLSQEIYSSLQGLVEFSNKIIELTKKNDENRLNPYSSNPKYINTKDFISEASSAPSLIESTKRLSSSMEASLEEMDQLYNKLLEYKKYFDNPENPEYSKKLLNIFHGMQIWPSSNMYIQNIGASIGALKSVISKSFAESENYILKTTPASSKSKMKEDFSAIWSSHIRDARKENSIDSLILKNEDMVFDQLSGSGFANEPRAFFQADYVNLIIDLEEELKGSFDAKEYFLGLKESLVLIKEKVQSSKSIMTKDKADLIKDLLKDLAFKLVRFSTSEERKTLFSKLEYIKATFSFGDSPESKFSVKVYENKVEVPELFKIFKDHCIRTERYVRMHIKIVDMAIEALEDSEGLSAISAFNRSLRKKQALNSEYNSGNGVSAIESLIKNYAKEKSIIHNPDHVEKGNASISNSYSFRVDDESYTPALRDRVRISQNAHGKFSKAREGYFNDIIPFEESEEFKKIILDNIKNDVENESGDFDFLNLAMSKIKLHLTKGNIYDSILVKELGSEEEFSFAMFFYINNISKEPADMIFTDMRTNLKYLAYNSNLLSNYESLIKDRIDLVKLEAEKMGVKPRFFKFLEKVYNNPNSKKYKTFISHILNFSDKDKNFQYSSIFYYEIFAELLGISIEDSIEYVEKHMNSAMGFEADLMLNDGISGMNFRAVYNLGRELRNVNPNLPLKTRAYITFKFFERLHLGPRLTDEQRSNLLMLVLNGPYSKSAEKTKFKQDLINIIFDLGILQNQTVKLKKSDLEESVSKLQGAGINIGDDFSEKFDYLQDAMSFSKRVFEDNSEENNPSMVKRLKKNMGMVKLISSLSTLSSESNSEKYEYLVKSKNLEKNKNLMKLNLDLIPGKLRFRVLEKGDPALLSVGLHTDCCQYIGGAGESAALDSIGNPNASVLILEFVPSEGIGDLDTKSGDSISEETDDGYHIISQSYFHYFELNESYTVLEKGLGNYEGSISEGFILDNIESAYKSVAFFDDEFGFSYKSAYERLAKKLESIGMGPLMIGSSFTEFMDSAPKGSIDEDPRAFHYSDIYTDFHHSDFILLDGKTEEKNNRFSSIINIYKIIKTA